MRHTADTSFLGLSAPRGSPGSGVGIGIQAKGTAVIHQRDRLPHNNLELFSNAPITTLEHYRGLGRNAAHYARGEMPEPVVVPTRGEAMGSRYHARVALLYAIETSLIVDGASPEEIEVSYSRGAAMGERKLGAADYPLAEKRPGADRGPARQAARRHHARQAARRRGGAGGSAHHAGGAALCRPRSRAPPDRPMLGRKFRARGGARRRPAGFHHGVYELLRPGRAKDKAPLLEAARKLRDEYKAERMARFVEEAAEVYERRGLFTYGSERAVLHLSRLSIPEGEPASLFGTHDFRVVATGCAMGCTDGVRWVSGLDAARQTGMTKGWVKGRQGRHELEDRLPLDLLPSTRRSRPTWC